MNTIKQIVVLSVTLLVAACSNHSSTSKKLSPPVTVRTLECADHLLAKTLSRVVLEHIRDDSTSLVELSDDRQTGIIITGTIVKKEVSTSGGASFGSVATSPSSGFGSAVANSNNFSGTIVEGVSLIAYIDGKEIASATYFQTPKRGSVESSQTVAKEAADELLEKLYKLGLLFEK